MAIVDVVGVSAPVSLQFGRSAERRVCSFCHTEVMFVHRLPRVSRIFPVSVTMMFSTSYAHRRCRKTLEKLAYSSRKRRELPRAVEPPPRLTFSRSAPRHDSALDTGARARLHDKPPACRQTS